MHFVRTAIIAAMASAALTGAALAAPDPNRIMLIAHPAGTVEHVPVERIRLVAVPAAPDAFFEAAFGPQSIFAEMDRMAATMDARAATMMQAPASSGPGIVMTNAQGQPVGVMRYSFVSSSTDAQGCTRTISYSSDGSAAADQPKAIRTSTGDCGAQAAPAPAIAPTLRAPRKVTPTTTQPTPKPPSRIIPVSAPEPAEIFTPSRT